MEYAPPAVERHREFAALSAERPLRSVSSVILRIELRPAFRFTSCYRRRSLILALFHTAQLSQDRGFFDIDRKFLYPDAEARPRVCRQPASARKASASSRSRASGLAGRRRGRPAGSLPRGARSCFTRTVFGRYEKQEAFQMNVFDVNGFVIARRRVCLAPAG